MKPQTHKKQKKKKKKKNAQWDNGNRLPSGKASTLNIKTVPKSKGNKFFPCRVLRPMLFLLEHSSSDGSKRI